MDRLLTLTEVSDMTGVPVATLRWLRAVHPERAPRMGKLAGRLRAKESDVRAWVEQELAATSTPRAS